MNRKTAESSIIKRCYFKKGGETSNHLFIKYLSFYLLLIIYLQKGVKNERKKLLIFILTVFCTFLVPIKGIATEITGTQDEALDAYEQILKVLEIRTDVLMDDYPDSFAGCYLDDNMLVILLTDLNDADIYLNACNNSPYVRFEKKNILMNI